MGLIAFDRVYLKADAASADTFAAAGCERFVYEGKGKRVTMDYWSAPAEALDSPALMLPWARMALQAALRARSAASLKHAGRKSAASAKTAATSAVTKHRRGPN
ncbi:MAG TPA: TfoX/Sxy family protein [Rubrivivax sp.]|nr:TfoX/Sxy family protein [Rubrivivax sp.]